MLLVERRRAGAHETPPRRTRRRTLGSLLPPVVHSASLEVAGGTRRRALAGLLPDDFIDRLFERQWTMIDYFANLRIEQPKFFLRREQAWISVSTAVRQSSAGQAAAWGEPAPKPWFVKASMSSSPAA